MSRREEHYDRLAELLAEINAECEDASDSEDASGPEVPGRRASESSFELLPSGPHSSASSVYENEPEMSGNSLVSSGSEHPVVLSPQPSPSAARSTPAARGAAATSLRSAAQPAEPANELTEPGPSERKAAAAKQFEDAAKPTAQETPSVKVSPAIARSYEADNAHEWARSTGDGRGEVAESPAGSPASGRASGLIATASEPRESPSKQASASAGTSQSPRRTTAAAVLDDGTGETHGTEDEHGGAGHGAGDEPRTASAVAESEKSAVPLSASDEARDQNAVGEVPKPAATLQSQSGATSAPDFPAKSGYRENKNLAASPPTATRKPMASGSPAKPRDSQAPEHAEPTPAPLSSGASAAVSPGNDELETVLNPADPTTEVSTSGESADGNLKSNDPAAEELDAKTEPETELETASHESRSKEVNAGSSFANVSKAIGAETEEKLDHDTLESHKPVNTGAATHETGGIKPEQLTGESDIGNSGPGEASATNEIEQSLPDRQEREHPDSSPVASKNLEVPGPDGLESKIEKLELKTEQRTNEEFASEPVNDEPNSEEAAVAQPSSVGLEPEDIEPKAVELEAVELEADEPEADEPEADEPEADEPEADELEADEPEADEPEADELEADEPEADEPEADEPEDFGPEADEPISDKSKDIEPYVDEPKESKVTDPEAVEPKADEPIADKPKDTDEPQATEPEVIEPEVIEPEAIEPKADESEEFEPEAPEPVADISKDADEPIADNPKDTDEPQATEPEAVEPKVVEPPLNTGSESPGTKDQKHTENHGTDSNQADSIERKEVETESEQAGHDGSVTKISEPRELGLEEASTSEHESADPAVNAIEHSDEAAPIPEGAEEDRPPSMYVAEKSEASGFTKDAGRDAQENQTHSSYSSAEHDVSQGSGKADSSLGSQVPLGTSASDSPQQSTSPSSEPVAQADSSITTKDSETREAEPTASSHPDVDDSNTVYIYASFASGVRGSMSRYNRVVSILESYGIKFVTVEITMDPRARRLWKYKGANKDKLLPAIFRDGDLKCDYNELLEANEYEDVEGTIFDGL